MSERGLYHELLIAGFGGQGVVLAGKLLATAALSENLDVVWAPSYGPEMRGGAVHCTVIVSSGRIGSPEVSQADSMLIMDAASLERCRNRIRPGGLLVSNASLVPSPPDRDSYEFLELRATEAAEELGNPRVANVIMLGAFLAARPVVSNESIVEAMRMSAGEAFEHLLRVNTQALARGAELAQAAPICP